MNLEYPLTIWRGNTFKRGFRFRDTNDNIVEDIESVKWSAGVGDTVFITKILTVTDQIYNLVLTQAETRLLTLGFSYELELKFLDGSSDTYLAGLIDLDGGDNIDVG